MPVIALDDDRQRATLVLEAEIRTAIREDFINSVVLGCAGMVHMTDNRGDGAVRRMRTRIGLLAQPKSMRSIIGATQ